jgi:hypothetical protein
MTQKFYFMTMMNTQTDLTLAQVEILQRVRGLIEHRQRLGALSLDLNVSGTAAEDEPEEPSDPAFELCSAIECLLYDHFDPLLRGLIGAVSSAGGQLAGAIQKLWAVERQLQHFAAQLPHSPLEEAMLEGEIEPDEPTEMRTVIGAVLDDQLDLAVKNLLYAALYRRPEEGETGPKTKGPRKTGDGEV